MAIKVYDHNDETGLFSAWHAHHLLAYIGHVKCVKVDTDKKSGEDGQFVIEVFQRGEDCIYCKEKWERWLKNQDQLC